MADSVESLGVDLRTRVKKLGVKEKARRKKCKVRFSLIKENNVSQTNYMKVGVKKLLRAGMVPARRGWKIEGQKKRSTRNEYKRLRIKFELKGLMAQKGLGG